MSRPADPALSPIADAFAAAEAEAAAEAATRALEQERDAAAAQERTDNHAYFLDAARRLGAARAMSVGRAFGFSNDELDAFLADAADREANQDGTGKAGRIKGKKKEAGPAEPDAPRPDDAPPPGEDGPSFKREARPIRPLPADCPVTPVGYQNTTFYYLNPHRHLIPMSKGAFSAEGIRLLFGQRQDWLWQHYPKFNEKTGLQSGWKADRSAESLIDAASRAGWFDPNEMIRGAGGWRGDAGELVLHLGSEVVSADAASPPGFVGGYLYAAGVSTQKPIGPIETPEDQARADGAIEALLTAFDSFNWLDGPGSADENEPDEARCFAADVDGSGHKLASLLVLGWLAGSRLGAALEFRSLMWITGDAGAGKTTLQRIIMAVTGRDMVQSSDTTGAGVYSAVGHSSRPVMIDEAEPDPFKSKMKDLIGLARQAATGGRIRRGSSNHQAVYFEAKSAFLFSSIIIPPMQGSDVSRFCILDLGQLGQRKPLALDPAQLAYAGRVMLRRLIEGWHRWQETLDAYRLALMAQGHDPRGADQFGVLLAACDLMRGKTIAHPDTIDALARVLNAERMNDFNPREVNAQSMLNHLITTPLDVFRGGTRMTIGELVGIAAGVVKPSEDGGPATPKACREALKSWSIFIDGFDKPATRTGSAARVILPNKSTALGRLFQGSQWYAEGGADGGWKQAMRRLKGAKAVKSSGSFGRGWSVPVHVFLQTDEEA
jgi:hypothetical protein